MKDEQAFSVGDIVEWRSQSRAYWTTKRGTVVAVVFAGDNPMRHVSELGLRTNTVEYGWPRNEDSYLVQVGNIAYWPRTKHLALAKEAKQ